MLRIAELLPAGDLATPNSALQVEWFYTSFHKSDCSEYVRSRRRLVDEMLTTLAQYFESIHDAWVTNGTLQKKCDNQIRQAACCDYHHKHQLRYNDKLKCIADKQANYSWQRNCDSNPTRKYKSRDRDQCKTGKKTCGDDRKAPPKGLSKKPCHVNGPESKHSYADCLTNPKNKCCASNNNNNYYYYYIKRVHKDAHYHEDNRRHSSDDESCKDPVMSLASNKTQASTLPSVASRTHENYHLDSFHIPKKSRSFNVPHKSPGNNALVEHESGLKKKLVQMPS